MTKSDKTDTSSIMKRVILTDCQTRVSRFFENPPWRLGQITDRKDDGTFDVHMIHEDGQELIINVDADRLSLTNRFKGW